MFFHGTQKEEFEGRWKNRHVVKRFMENKVEIYVFSKDFTFV